MPKILLLLPPAPAHYVVPPVGLGYLATALREQGFRDVAILDGQKARLTRAALTKTLLRDRPDIVGIQVFSSGFTTSRRAAQIVKQALPQAVVIVGGPHVTATAERALLDLPEADYGFCGEAEPGLPDLVRHLAQKAPGGLGKVPGLIYRDGPAVRVNPRAIVDDLESLGFPAWDLMAPGTYPDSPQGAFYRQFPIAPVLTSRGCPYECTFCGSPVNMTRAYRTRPMAHVLDEVELLYKQYGVREIHIIDDMFALQKERVMAFCAGLVERRLSISYTFPNGLRLNALDREMLLRMKETGAYAFTVGIESGSDRILQAMKKRLTTDFIRKQVTLITECGLEPSGFFILGFPDETRQDMEATMAFARSLPIKRAHFSNYLPLPGTESTQRLYESGEVQPGNWDALAYYDAPYAPKGMTPVELKGLQRKAFLKFHLRPRILVKLLIEVRSPRHLKSLAERARDYLFVRRKQDNFLA
jgi:radical SAM superfamily enzyme YgiQ (UPF0313 family)